MGGIRHVDNDNADNENDAHTLVTKMVASAPDSLCLVRRSCRGNSQMTSLLSTKNGSPLPSSRISRATARGPAVPMGSVSCSDCGHVVQSQCECKFNTVVVHTWEAVILMPSLASHSSRNACIFCVFKGHVASMIVCLMVDESPSHQPHIVPKNEQHSIINTTPNSKHHTQRHLFLGWTHGVDSNCKPSTYVGAIVDCQYHFINAHFLECLWGTRVGQRRAHIVRTMLRARWTTNQCGPRT